MAERALAARLRRQQILDRADGTAPRLVAVITEASLLYRWGSAHRRAQVAHLAAASRRRTSNCGCSGSPAARTRA